MSFSETKDQIRKQAIERRTGLALRSELSQNVARNFLASIPVPPGAVVSSYFAIDEEADPSSLVAKLRQRGHRIVLPRVSGRNQPLDFHLWTGDTDLVRGGFGLSEPSREWPKLSPDVLIVPLLAFDRRGYRIGYGAGYYDRTLRMLRQAKEIVAAGFAFSAQEFVHLPHAEHDERLDWMVTDAGALKFQDE
jgi:5-formyltetrahydrofolate cyclo-ligase